jgi:hypothetical protein
VARRDYELAWETNDSIKLAESKGKSGFFGAFSKVDIRDSQVADSQDIIADHTLQATRAVSNFEFRAVGLVGLRGLAIVLGMEKASDRGAAGGRDP